MPGPRVLWTREHQLIALNLYRKLPFGKLHSRNPIIKDIASKMGRTPSSLAMKLTNFASLDPFLRARGIVGMSGVSKDDRHLWDEFHRNAATLVPESEQLLHDLVTNNENFEVDLLRPEGIRLEASVPLPVAEGATEGRGLVKIRRGQQFFRQSILRAYDVRCCISDIPVAELLVASHIKPWKDFPAERLDPSNGLCLSSLHDRAFDRGLITLDEKLTVVLSNKLRRYFPHPALERSFLPFEGKKIRLPEQLAEPSSDYLKYHRERIFRE